MGSHLEKLAAVLERVVPLLVPPAVLPVALRREPPAREPPPLLPSLNAPTDQLWPSTSSFGGSRKYASFLRRGETHPRNE